MMRTFSLPLNSSLVQWRHLAVLLSAALGGAVISPQAFASDITVASPSDGARIASPVLVKAHNVGCDGFAPTSFSYSIDDSAGLVLGETPYDIDVANDPVPAGTHTIHFKSWTSHGMCPVVSATFTVGATSPYAIPAYAISSGDLDLSDGWHEIHDGGTPGKSEGTTTYPASTPLYDDARKFYMTYSDRAGERWATLVGVDRASTYFVLDTYVYLPNPSEVLNLEMDVDHTLADGNTVILGTQCSGVNKAWEYAFTVGRLDHWWATHLKCDPSTWTANVWHHVQVGMHHDATGIVTHDWVTFDGVTSNFEDATRQSSHFIEWAPGITNTQFQIEGSSATTGTATAYIHKLTVYRWQPE
jgi:hypothetical protein